ncbi:hypothetical protein YC2023_075525 [Brassica napus]
MNDSVAAKMILPDLASLMKPIQPSTRRTSYSEYIAQNFKDYSFNQLVKLKFTNFLSSAGIGEVGYHNLNRRKEAKISIRS